MYKWHHMIVVFIWLTWLGIIISIAPRFLQMELFHSFYGWVVFHAGSPGGSDGKESACSVKDPGSIPGSRRSPGEGNGTPLQYSCLENPMDRGAWWATVHGVTKSQIRLSNFTFFLSSVPCGVCVCVCVCVCILYPLICWWTFFRFFHVLAVVNSANRNTEVCISLWIIVLSRHT